ncbi:FtsK/SpoIIIE family DNA translocase [Olsenella profusa]|uniref:DNA translocase FtsK 4TM domain-containing protein n=1 Tax=Olsenella profusa TaxID=138595 RepID=A0ABS2F3X7_9ACTN|nr:DNA translocase FtsK [Olsenella profusa]MBM6775268.1 DNA translocase FtsK 4TM domain-containing protein [Olsenella profusa]
MPAKRTSNAAKRPKSKARGASPRGRQAAAASLVGTAQGDILGVVVAVVAVALLAALLFPTQAVLTSAVHDFLALSFGAAAPLVPVALFAFAMTFFLGGDEPVSGRVALGLSLIVLAVLAMVSLNLPGAEADPASVFAVAAAERAGGYVGGAVAYALLELVGPVVGNVVLVGVIVAGVVVCGFSVSGVVASARARITAAAQAHEERSRERRDQRIIDAVADDGPEPPAQGSLFDEDGAAQTSFIGNRKTSVLRRGSRSRGAAVGETRATLLDATDAEAKTTLLDRTAHGEKNDAGAGSVPSFLSGADKGGAARAGRAGRAPKGESRAASAAPKTIHRPGDDDESYELPPLSILRVNPDASGSYANEDELTSTAAKLQATLEEFGLTSRVEGWIAGPSVTTFKISMGEGERVSKIVNLEDDIALSLAAKSVRIFAPIPGTSLVGIEIPNEKPQPVFLSDVLPYATGGPLDCAFGRDSEGRPIVVDLAGLPHLLVAGTTGSGKSVLLNAIIMSMLMRATPEQVRLIMVDPKRVEFTGYAGLPHLYVPVVTEPRQAASALQWGVTEMERRLKVFEHYKVRDIKTYNGNVDGGKYADMENPPKHMPYFVIVIDELADLMMVAGKDVESSIVRIAQLGRAAGIHLIVATQRPSADVVTGLIRANIDNRVALSVDNSINSRIILDQKGAEQLLGKGDMLVKLRGKKPRRAQGCWVSDEEIEQTVKFICGQVAADYHEDILTAVVPTAPGSGDPAAARDDDPLVWEAARIVVDSQLGSTSGLQRALSVGYARAGRIMDMLEAKGVVGPANGSKPREVLLDKEGLEDLQAAEAAYREVE